MVERINYKNLPTIVGPYGHATKHANTLYVSGLTAMGSDAQKEGFVYKLKKSFRKLIEF